MLRKLFVVMAVLALIAAACGDNAEDTTTTTGASATTVAGPTSPEEHDVHLCDLNPSTDSVCQSIAAAQKDITVALNRELYGRLLEQTKPASDPSQIDGPVIFGEVVSVQDPNRPVPGCTYLRGQFIISARYDQNDLPPDAEVTPLKPLIDDAPFEYAVVRIDSAEDPYDFVQARYNPADPTISLHYVLLPAPRWNWSPDNDPTPVDPPDPAVSRARFEGNRSLVVLDTKGDPAVIEGVQDPAAGHGEFIVSLIEALSPNATIALVDPTDDDEAKLGQGRIAITELSLYNTAIRNEVAGAAVVNTSLGAYGCPKGKVGGPPMLPLLLQETVESVVGSGAVLVAAAGNDGLENVRFFPAGFGTNTAALVASPPENASTEEREANQNLRTALDALETNVISVGACRSAANNLCGESQKAGFSNHGDWVELYAPGVDAVGSYTGNINYTYDYMMDNQVLPLDFGNLETAMLTIGASGEAFWPRDDVEIPANGFVSWSGTSFAAPFVAAMIAGHTGGATAVEACDDLFNGMGPQGAGACKPTP